MEEGGGKVEDRGWRAGKDLKNFENQQIHKKSMLYRWYTRIAFSGSHGNNQKPKTSSGDSGDGLGRDSKISPMRIYTLAIMGANMGHKSDSFSGYRAFSKVRI